VRSIPSPSRRDRRPHDDSNFVHLFKGARPLLCTSKGLAAATLSALRRHFHIYFEVSRDLQCNSLPLRHLSSSFQPGTFVAEATFRWNPGTAGEYMGPQQLPERLAELQLRLPSLRTIHIILTDEVDYMDTDEPTVAFQETLEFLRFLGHALPLTLTTSLVWDFWGIGPGGDEIPVKLEHLKAVLGAIGATNLQRLELFESFALHRPLTQSDSVASLLGAELSSLSALRQGAVRPTPGTLNQLVAVCPALVSLHLAAQSHGFFPSIPHSIRDLTVAFDLDDPYSFVAANLAFEAACEHFPRLTNVQSFTLKHPSLGVPSMAEGWEWSMAPPNVRRLTLLWHYMMPPLDDLCLKLRDASWLPKLSQLKIRGPTQTVRICPDGHGEVVWGWGRVEELVESCLARGVVLDVDEP
jgi:hypothetical protein